MKPSKQTIDVNFSGGLDTKTDSKQVQQGKFLALQNSIFDKGGLLEKRNGYVQRGTTVTPSPTQVLTNSLVPGTIASGLYNSAFNNELVLGDGLNFYSYLKSLDTWGYKGRNEILGMSVESIYRSDSNQQNADVAINETIGAKLTAWENYQYYSPGLNTFNYILYSVEDTVTGQQFNEFVVNAGAGTESRPRCVSIGSHLYLLYYSSASSSLIAQEVTLSGGFAPVTLVNNIDTTNSNYDVTVINGNLYVAYTGTGTTTKVASFSAALAPIASTSKAENSSNGVGLWGDTSNNVWVAYNSGISTKAFIMDSALAVTVLAPLVVDAGSGSQLKQNVTGVYDPSTSKSFIFYDQPGVPAVGSQIATLGGAFIQPAVGSSVLVTTSGSASTDTLIGYKQQIIYVVGGGFYEVNGSVYNTDNFFLKNLGYVGNAAPAATVPASAAVDMAGGKINAVTKVKSLTSAGTLALGSAVSNSAALCSRAFMSRNAPHVIIGYDSTVQPTYFVASVFNTQVNIDTSYGHFPLKIFAGLAGAIPNKSILANVTKLANGTFETALCKRYVAQTIGDNENTFFAGVNSIIIDPAPTQINPVALATNLHMPTGTLWMYDGLNVVEHNFNVFPEFITGAITHSAGYLVAGVYGYQVIWTWFDLQGNKHLSAPSAIFTVTAVNNDLVTLTIPTLRLTEKTNVNAEIFRTTANGNIFYSIGIVANTTEANTITFSDGKGDFIITANQELYTTGEVQDNACPSTGLISSFKSRLLAIPLDEEDSLYYSKQVTPVTPVQFSNAFVQNVTTVGGGVSTVAGMDDKLILYKENTIYYMIGSGPAASGANNDFTDPILVTTDAGAIDKNSVVFMPLGHMFKSSKGIYLLDRGLQANYIGAEVEAYNQYDVLSSTLIENTNQVRFALTSGDTLVYDYFYKQWSVFGTLNTISSCIFQGNYAYIKSDGSSWQETPGVYLDGTNPVLMSFTTAWIKLAGLQGYQRSFFFYILGQYLSPHTLTLNIAYDYSGSSSQTATITPVNPTANTIERWRVFLARQRCQSIQISLQENHTTSNGAGFNLSGLQFVIGVKSGFRPTDNSDTTA